MSYNLEWREYLLQLQYTDLISQTSVFHCNGLVIFSPIVPASKTWSTKEKQETKIKGSNYEF